MAAASWSNGQQLVWTGLDGAALGKGGHLGASRGRRAVAPPRWTVQPTVVVDAHSGAQLAAAPHRQGRGSFIPRRLCAHWTRSGWCRKGDACTFAHGPHELHPDAQMALMQASLGEAAARPPPYPADSVPGAGAERKFDPGIVETGTHFATGPGEFKFNVNAPVFVVNSGISDFIPCGTVGEVAEVKGLVNPESALDSGAPQFTVVPTPGLAPSDAAVPSVVMEGGIAAGPADDSALVLAAPQPGDEPVNAIDAGVFNGDEATKVNWDAQTKPQGRRKAPMPLTTVEAADAVAPTTTILPQSPIQIQGGTLPNASPAAAAARRFLTRIGAAAPSSPVRQVVFTTSQLSSPQAVLSPRMLFSPAGAAARAPASPAAASPGPAAPGSPQPISRGALLQARGVAQKIHQGAPGLAMYAPTPTSAARSFGFVYPQPGFFRTEAQPPTVAAAVQPCRRQLVPAVRE